MIVSPSGEFILCVGIVYGVSLRFGSVFIVRAFKIIKKF